jgi:hypothetical protein
VFIPTAMAIEIARYRNRDFVARADRYRLSQRVSQSATLSGSPRLRALILRWLLCSRARGSVTPMSEPSNLDGHASPDASAQGAFAADPPPHCSHGRAATP